MDRLLRFTVLAVSAATLLWLSGCSDLGGKPAAPPKPSGGIAAEIQRKNAERAEREAAAAVEKEQATQAALAAEGPSEITKDDFKKGSKITSNGYLGTVVREDRRAGEGINLANLEYNLKIHAAANGWPKSHEAFMKLARDEWGMPFPELVEPYEYWYDAESHRLLKRPKLAAADAATGEGDDTE